jgi:hypothetical protein
VTSVARSTAVNARTDWSLNSAKTPLDTRTQTPCLLRVTTGELLSRRLVNQQLAGSRFSEAGALIAWMGAMQAQEYAMAKRAIGLRVPGTTDASIESAFNAGSILRTHVLRPTWHFVAPEDIRWMLALTAPRVRAAMAYMNRQVELDAHVFKRARTAIQKTLAGGKHLNRSELQEAFRRAKISADGVRLAHLLMDAELDGLLCSGRRQGKTFTYALLDERVPAVPTVDRDTALARLSERYFASRGPATAEDFAWWSGLTLKDARRGVSSLGGNFVHETINGRQMIFSGGPPKPGILRQANFLQPDYDEYGIAYKDRSAMFAGASAGANANKREIAYNRMIVVAGRMIGSWRRTERKGKLVIEAVPFTPLTTTQRQSLNKSVARYAAFVDRQCEVRALDATRRNA